MRITKSFIIIYSVDGLEGITKDTLTSDLLNKTDYQKTELLNNQKITAGSLPISL